MYYTYMIRCKDDSIYTGITTDLNRRMKEHFERTEKCAKYTKRHEAKKILIAFESNNKSEATRLEFYLKTLTKTQKEEIVINGNIEKYLVTKLDTHLYHQMILENIVNKVYL